MTTMTRALFLSLAALFLLQLASAQAHRRHGRQQQHVKKGLVTITETYIAEETAEPQVVIFVDQHGEPASTITEGLPTKIYKAPAASSVITSLAQSVLSLNMISSSTSGPLPTNTPRPIASNNGYGLAYSPYNRDGSCKSAAQVLGDFEAFEGYGLIRTYGTDCDQVATVYAACKASGKMLFAGIFSLSNLNDEISILISGVGNDWSAMHTVSIGNELVNSGDASASDVMAAVLTARGLLKAAGYNGPVVTVDTLAATLKPGNSILCDESDYCAVNAHPFFDSATSAERAGQWLIDNVNTLKASIANPLQKIVIAETGWPSGGSPNGAAIPSPENQKTALHSIMSSFSSNPSGVILLSAYNRQWLKGNIGEFDQEYWFGIFGDCLSG